MHALPDENPQLDWGKMHIGDFADATTVRLSLKREAVAVWIGLELLDVFRESVEVILRPVELQVHAL